MKHNSISKKETISMRLKKNDWGAYLYILPSLIIISLFVLYPAIWALNVSFKDLKPLQLLGTGLFEIPGKFVGLSNYVSIFKDPLFRKSIFNTIYFGIVFIPLTMLGSMFLATLVNTEMKGVGFLRSVFFTPYIVSIISASMIFMMLFSGDKGLINGVLDIFGVKGPSWLSESALAMPVIAIMSSWRRVGYFMLIYLAALQNIPAELYEAAALDGASKFQTFRKITWPMLSKMNTVVFILLLVNCLNVFQEIFIMTGGGPGDSTTTIPFLIYNSAFKYFKFGRAAAMSYVLFTILVIVTLIRNKMTASKEVE
ncbi:sugar ABC transporter permease [Acidaminobacter sp. JC074]|uniref:carbohydrate ABC transporter permease n=1 Tax=Acidaminobacter sp. JC074 TaxID=2530199 RepID=UPI001F0D330B|nr:sugar ABC transporter permease [Acidaminobacter sp. JC074]MCH4888018.1 sugar ABC transporter permease [Acidaminobacter sp. JC074]